MAVQVNPITQSLPATTAIQDPATRRFAQAVEDALRALRSEEGAVESLKKAADAMNNAVAGGTPPSIAQWLFSSELYQKLTTEIARVDTQAKQDVLDEALARSQAIQEIQAALAEIESTPAYDPATTYQVGDLVTYDNKLYRAKAETTGNPPTNTTYWDKVGDYASLGDVVAAHTLQLSEIESDITDIGGDLAAEITARDTLATQLRGTYAGTDVEMVSQGLLYSERQARVTADGVTVSNLNALRAQVGVTEAGALTEGFILNEQTIRNTNDLAIVSAVNTALAQITGVSTSISQSGENLIANWTTAQANKWSQIEAEVLTAGGQTIRAALLEEANTRASLAGDVYASYTLRVDVNGNIAGFGLAADENSSEFIIRADKFAVVMPGYGDYVPFAIGQFGPMLLDSGGFNVPVNDLVSASANPTSFLESFQSGNLAQWTNHSGSGELSIVSVSDSLTGGKVLRIGNNSGNDQAWLIHKQNIPFDPTALYRIKFRVRRTAGAGTVYLGVAGVAADGVTWVNTSGANSVTGQHYIAAVNQSPGSSWTEYVGYVKGTAATGQSGTNPPVTAPLKLHQNVKYIRPLILANYPNVAGTMEVDYCSIELMTDAMSWDAVAGEGKDAIVNTLADIASDSKLTPAEKKITKKEWDGIVAEKSGINSQASALGITTENTAYNNAYNALNTYITPLLSSLTTTSNIVGSTFRSTFSSFYTARQALLNKISAVAATKADWGAVTGKTGFASISQITSSNVTTYIDNAALGNAQIGGNLWSTNWNYAGGTGWLLDRSGNFYGNNVYARGDIEASSLKANTAMVDTLHIAGEAVIVPRYAESSSTVSLPVANTSYAAISTSSFTFSGRGSVVLIITASANPATSHSNTNVNYPEARILRNGVVIKSGITINDFTAYTFRDTSTTPGSRYYTLDFIVQPGFLFDVPAKIKRRTLVIIGAQQ